MIILKNNLKYIFLNDSQNSSGEINNISDSNLILE